MHAEELNDSSGLEGVHLGGGDDSWVCCRLLRAPSKLLVLMMTIDPRDCPLPRVAGTTAVVSRATPRVYWQWHLPGCGMETASSSPPFYDPPHERPISSGEFHPGW